MSVNVRKDLRILNPTKYFDPSKDKTRVRFRSPSSFQYQKMKVESFEVRLYWQYRYCASLGCKTFFYTLTYNNEHLPFKYGKPCFDYEDLRDLFTGGFRKQLLRKYGQTFKYFVGAELGSGCGKRGLGNNPHYHILFFLEPANNPSFPFKQISSLQFRNLIRLYWQGFDQRDGFLDYRKCKFGIAKEGSENIGEVIDYRAVAYCAKYVTKDVRLKMREVEILKLLRFRYHMQLQSDLEFHKKFFHNIVKPSFFANEISDQEAFVSLLPEITEFANRLYDLTALEIFDNDETFVKSVKLVCRFHNLWKEYFNFLNEEVDDRCRIDLNEWRNRYCNKPRISQNVGCYALNFIEDLQNPRIEILTKKGKRMRLLPLYLYRKLFTGIVKPVEQFYNGKFYQTSSVRVLNREGINYKLSQLDKNIQMLSDKTKSLFALVVNDKLLFQMMLDSDVNTECHYSFDDFKFRLSQLKVDFQDDYIYKQYAVYRLVYEDRCFEFQGAFPVLHYKKDYEFFLQPSVFSVPRSDLALECFVENSCKNYMYYETHPDFLRFAGIFAVFNLVSDYFAVQADIKAEEEQKERDRIRSFHVSQSLN